LRTAANKTLPDAWANRTKKGFPVPIAKWLEDPAFSAKVRKSFTKDLAVQIGHAQLKAVCHAHLVGLQQNVPGQPQVQVKVLLLFQRRLCKPRRHA